MITKFKIFETKEEKPKEFSFKVNTDKYKNALPNKGSIPYKKSMIVQKTEDKDIVLIQYKIPGTDKRELIPVKIIY